MQALLKILLWLYFRDNVLVSEVSDPDLRCQGNPTFVLQQQVPVNLMSMRTVRRTGKNIEHITIYIQSFKIFKGRMLAQFGQP
jgi:hypothetical protein